MGCLRKKQNSSGNNSYQEAFDKVKSMICKDTTLWYFDIHKPVTVQGDTSQKSLSAALLQDGCPVAFCFQSSYTYGTALCQQRMWTAHLYLWSRMIPHLCLWPCLYYWEWLHTTQTDQYLESCRCTSPSTENTATTPKLWCHHHVLTWQRDVDCRSSALLCTPQGSRHTFRHHHQPCTHHTWQKNWIPDSNQRWPTTPLLCWDDHYRLARCYQWCPKCYTPILWP